MSNLGFFSLLGLILLAIACGHWWFVGNGSFKMPKQSDEQQTH